MHVLWWVVVGLIAGWATGKIMRGPGDGILMDIVIGSAGALTGGFIMGSVGAMPAGAGPLYSIPVAIGGAVILTAGVRFFTGRKALSGRLG